MIYNNKKFKKYDNMYYVSADGDVYSTRKNGLLKHYITNSGHHRVDIHGKHMFIHRLVYIIWVGNIPNGLQVNHYDDNKDNNHYSNLYLGTQKDNIDDCFKNGSRVGHVYTITIYDKLINEIIVFPSVLDFITYSGHSVANGSLSKCMSHKWFKNRYELIERKSVETIENYISIQKEYKKWVENKALMHEVSRVGWSLSPSEAQGISF